MVRVVFEIIGITATMLLLTWWLLTTFHKDPDRTPAADPSSIVVPGPSTELKDAP